MITLMARGASAVPGVVMVTCGGGDRDSCAPMTTRVTVIAKNPATTSTGAREILGAGRGWNGVTPETVARPRGSPRRPRWTARSGEAGRRQRPSERRGARSVRAGVGGEHARAGHRHQAAQGHGGPPRVAGVTITARGG